jgi:predicted MPP superfamily phosphohydrolase
VSNGQVWFLTILFCAAFTLYSAAVVMLLRVLAGRIFSSLKPASRLHRRTRMAIWILAALGILAVLYARFVEPNWLEVTHLGVKAAGLPAGAGPIRIALLSDLHTESFERLESQVAAAVERERPDLILYAGDSLNAAAGLPVFRRLMSRLAATAPTFAVRGNWDGLFHADLFGGTGVRELKAGGAAIDVRGAKLWVAGLPAGRSVAPERLAREACPGTVRILLGHWPNELCSPATGEFDLCCAGHTHGGQIALPFYGAILKSPPEGPHYERGLYMVNGTPLVVTRGIGMEGGAVFRARFCSRPEVTIVELAPK